MTRESLYWYVAIFAWQFFTGIGIPPLPEEATIFWAGIMASTHSEVVRWYIAWPICIVGVILADLVLYGAGRYWGQRLFSYAWVNRVVPPEKRESIERGFHRHGVKIMITGRLLPLPGIRTAVFLTAGTIRYPFYRFLMADIFYAIPGIGLFFFGAYFLTNAFVLLYERVHSALFWVLLPVILLVGAFIFYRYLHYLRKRTEAKDYAPPRLPELVPHPNPNHRPGQSGVTTVETPVKPPAS